MLVHAPQSTQKRKSQRSLQTYLQMEKNGPFSEEARSILKILIPESGKIKGILSRNGKSSVEKESPKDMVLVSPGFFIMGSNRSLKDEAPEHRVYLDSYWIDKYEVSAGKFAEFLNTVDNVKGYYLDNKFGTLYYDSRFHPRPGLENYPINNITWKAADAYCKWGKNRLPTEAEWEAAARCGEDTLYAGSAVIGDVAWYYGNSTGTTHTVATKASNACGLYDMSGNVWEWNHDWYSSSYYSSSPGTDPGGATSGVNRVLRGGSWYDIPAVARVAFRVRDPPDVRSYVLGLRLVRTSP